MYFVEDLKLSSCVNNYLIQNRSMYFTAPKFEIFASLLYFFILLQLFEEFDNLKHEVYFENCKVILIMIFWHFQYRLVLLRIPPCFHECLQEIQDFSIKSASIPVCSSMNLFNLVSDSNMPPFCRIHFDNDAIGLSSSSDVLM